MTAHRYELEKKGQKKQTCPQCRRPKVFVRYIDLQDNSYLGEEVGRCDREVNCGYHYKPSEYFAANEDKRPKNDNWIAPVYTPKPRVNIPYEIMAKSMQGHDENTFISYLKTIFPLPVVEKLTADYLIGTSKRYQGGGGVFWFVNKAGEVRYGQVKHFDETGHTSSYIDNEQKTRKCIDTVHSILKRAALKAEQTVPAWITAYEAQDLKQDCMFGEQLLARPENDSKPIAIVEAPKTAIVASAFFPQYVWLAIGGLSFLKRQRCGVLYGRNVVLFPDLMATDKWKARVINEELDKIAKVKVSTFLEDHATDQDKEKGLDLCDYLEKLDYMQFLKAEMIATVSAPGYTGTPKQAITEYMERGLTAEIIKNEVLQELQKIAA